MNPGEKINKCNNFSAPLLLPTLFHPLPLPISQALYLYKYTQTLKRNHHSQNHKEFSRQNTV